MHGRCFEPFMATTMAAIEVAVPIRMAYDRFADPESHARFMRGIEDVRQLDEQSALVHGTSLGHDRTWRMTWTGTPPERLEWLSPGGPEERTTATFETVAPQRTRITLTRHHHDLPPGALERTQADLESFREYVEAFERDPWIEVRPPIIFV